MLADREADTCQTPAQTVVIYLPRRRWERSCFGSDGPSSRKETNGIISEMVVWLCGYWIRCSGYGKVPTSTDDPSSFGSRASIRGAGPSSLLIRMMSRHRLPPASLSFVHFEFRATLVIQFIIRQVKKLPATALGDQSINSQPAQADFSHAFKWTLSKTNANSRRFLTPARTTGRVEI